MTKKLLTLMGILEMLEELLVGDTYGTTISNLITKALDQYKICKNVNIGMNVLVTSFTNICENIDKIADKELLNKIALNVYTQNKWSFNWWPQLSPIQNLMSYLFFPQELNDSNDSFLYDRGYIFCGLTFSAKYGNPLAYHILSKIVENRLDNDDIIADSVVDQLAVKHDMFLYRSRVAMDNINVPENVIYPFFGLYLLSESNGREILENGKDVDARCAYQLGVLEHDEHQKKLYYEKACELGYNKGYLGLASMEKDNLKSSALCLKAKNGEGLFESAKLIREYEGHGDLYLLYLEEAGAMGCSIAYDELASYYQDKNDIENFKRIYMAQVKLGDRSKYYIFMENYPEILPEEFEFLSFVSDYLDRILN